MRIKSVNIAAFGGIKNKTIRFDDGLNVIYGENENGKTTVMSFIKMMFYGSGRGSAKIEKNLRKKYTPWDGSAMAGSIDFEQNGKNYRLEREFRSSDSTDKIALLDLDLGTRQSVSSDIGSKLLGLSLGAFERSVFIGQAGAFESDADAEGEINSKLSNIVSTGDESVSFNTVIARLEKAKTALKSKSGRVGEYDKNLKQIEELEKELEKTEKIRNDYEDFKIRAGAFRAEMAKKAQTATELKKKLDSEKDVRNAEKLRQFVSLKTELDKLNKDLALEGGGYADEMFVKKLEFCLRKTENAEKSFKDKVEESNRLDNSIKSVVNKGEDITPEKCEELKQKLKNTEAQKYDLNEKLSKTDSEYNLLLAEKPQIEKSRKKVNLLLFIASGLLLISAVIGYFVFGGIIALMLGSAAFCFFGASFLLAPEDKQKKQGYYNNLALLEQNKNELKKELDNKTSETEILKAKYETVNTALNTSAAMLEAQKKLLLECMAEAESLEKQLETEKKALFELFGRYKSLQSIEQIIAETENIAILAAKQKEIKQQLNFLARDIGNISYDEAREKLNTLPEAHETAEDFEQLKINYETIINELSDKKEQLAAAEAKATSFLENIKEPETLKKQIKELKAITKAQEEYCSALDFAAEILKDSFGELRRGYGSALEQKSGEIFKGLTGGRYETMQISKAFDINVESKDAFGGKETAFLSSGTQDQAYLSLRLALSELIFETAERLPILLDDALTQYDDSRMNTAVSYLKELSADNQIIMFTCHNSVYNTAKNEGAVCADFKEN